MFASVKKMISGEQVSDSAPHPQRRPPSTPPLPLKTRQLVAKQPETPVVLRDHRKVRGHFSGVRESWPTATAQRSLTPPSRAQPITEARPRPTNQPRPALAAAPHPHWSVPGRGSEATMTSLLLFCRSSSSSSLVAIDNKIEQAMDLVKSHLMLAVREEVELLREQIRDLQDKNQQLERENHILRALTHNLHT
uniref:TSC22 domain family protein 3 n=1 Tax=Stegastes partitus TaxID=144197 RepID=A0A3B4Z2D6_9TELE